MGRKRKSNDSFFVGALILLFLAIALHDKFTSTEEDSNLKLCLVMNKVKSIGLLGDDFGTDDPITEECERTFERVRHEYMKMIAQVLIDNKEYIPTEEDRQTLIECVMDKLEKSKIVETFLAIKAASETDPENDDDELLIFLKSKFNVTVDIATEYCKDSSSSSGGFSDFFFSSNLTIYDDEPRKDVCIRRFIATNHLIPIPGVALNLNPNKIDISSTECLGMVQEHFNVYSEKMATDSFIYRVIRRSKPSRLNDEFKECINSVIRGENFVEKFLPFQYVPVMTFGDEQRDQLKLVINETFRDYFDKTFACDDIE